MSEEDAIAKPWEKQPWESPKAFQAFVTYYLNQPKPRSAQAAYRAYLAAQGKTSQADSAPGYWARWSQAKDGRDRPIPGGIGWQARAAAYDSWIQQRIVEERVKRATRIGVQWEDVTATMFTKFRTVVEAYDPTTEGADLMTLLTAMEKLQRVSANVFGMKPPTVVEIGTIGESAAKSATGEGLTVADRLRTIAHIFGQAVDRQGDVSGSGVEGSGDLLAAFDLDGAAEEGPEEEAYEEDT